MPRENVEIVREGYAAFAAGKPEDALSKIDSSFVATRVAPMPDAVPYHGPEGLMQILADWTQDLDEFAMTPEEFLDANNEQVVVRVHQQAVGAQSRVPIEADFWFVHTLHEERQVRIDIYGSESQALKAVGLEG